MNPFSSSLKAALLSSAFVWLKSDQFHQIGDFVEFDRCDGPFEVSDNCHLNGESSAVGSDTWTVMWVLEGLIRGELGVLSDDFDVEADEFPRCCLDESKKKKILELYASWEDHYDEEEEMDAEDAFWDAADECFGDYEVYEGYSGRLRYGKPSEAALVTHYHPDSPKGRAFIDETGASADNMGSNFVYYL
jgi:hypothetical protein